MKNLCMFLCCSLHSRCLHLPRTWNLAVDMHTFRVITVPMASMLALQ